MGKRLDLVGQKFGRLIVLKYVGNNKRRHSQWLCKCDCGNETVIVGSELKRNDKRKTRSCGCLQREIASEYHKNNQFGENNPMYGKSHTEGARQKIAESRVGKKPTDETRQRMRDNHADVSGKNNPMYGKGDDIRGENNPNWKGGSSSEDHLIRTSIKYKEWRRAVYKRDNYACQMCGKRGGKLHSHHIYSFVIYLGMRFRLWNGITLCKTCHEKTYGKEDQYIEQFLKITLRKLKKIILTEETLKCQ